MEGEKETDALLSVSRSGSSLSEDRTFLFSIELNSSRCPPPPAVNDELVVSSVNRRKGVREESIDKALSDGECQRVEKEFKGKDEGNEDREEWER